MVLREAFDEQPFLLASLAPSREQNRLAIGVFIAIFLVFAVTVPFTYVQLPRVDAFIPAFETAILISDLITSALLFAQFTVMRQWALLVLASGFLYTALIVIPHALTFPGAFVEFGLLGAGLQTTVWLYIFWHVGSPMAVIAYVLLKDKDSDSILLRRSPIVVGFWCVAAVIALVCGLSWVATEGDWLLPQIFLDRVRVNQNPSSLFGGLIISMNIAALVLLWLRRRSVLDLWLMVMCWTWLIEAMTAAVLISTRFSLGWYAGRIYALIGTIFVLLVLLSETTTLYAHLARSVVKQRREREGRQITMDVMAASIAHEVNQPLGAIVANAEAALCFLAKRPPNIDEVRVALEAITSDGIRGSGVVAGLRAVFKKEVRGRVSLDINDLIREALVILDIELRTEGVSVSAVLRSGIPRLFADRSQLQEVFLNLIMNAVESMRSVNDRIRELRISSDFKESSDVRIMIEDSGAGIDRNNVDRIFEPFFTTKSTGTGIGLSICRSIVDAHGGSLSASANSPYGTIFLLELPIES